MSLNVTHLSRVSPLSTLTETLLQSVDQLIWDLIKSVPPSDLPIASNLQQAITHHISSGGQRTRVLLTLQACLGLGMPSSDAVVLAAVVELVHNASLIHDDLQDRDRLRRGRSSVWAAYGDNVAICAGDLLLSMAYGAIAQFSQPDLLPRLVCAVHEKIAQAIAGQCADLQAQHHPVNSLEVYEKIVVGKSGALLCMPLELALVATSNAQLVTIANQVGNLLALGYQVVDDIDDLKDDYKKNEMPPSLNICLVLQAAGHKDDFLAMAREIGLEHLGKAQKLARHLPCGVTDCIIDLAQCLARRL